MSSTLPIVPPPGWYPDPSGSRQWRVWTGDRWSEMTRSYGVPSAPSALVAQLPLVIALHRVLRYGVLGFYAGLGLVVGILAHWPGTAHPASSGFAVTTLYAGVALLVLGLTTFVFAAKELEGRWSVWALIPGINVMAVSVWVTRRLGGQPVRRVVSEAILLALFIGQFRSQSWLVAAPVLLALSATRSTEALVDQLVAPATPQRVIAT
ncbi:MAG: DUF2510 domain-containing protein [Acidimicrobiaceae bacterium]|nr:DUF2510 domain-containing protein [Acidimicrobiaceae bacterium]